MIKSLSHQRAFGREDFDGTPLSEKVHMDSSVPGWNGGELRCHGQELRQLQGHAHRHEPRPQARGHQVREQERPETGIQAGATHHPPGHLHHVCAQGLRPGLRPM